MRLLLLSSVPYSSTSVDGGACGSSSEGGVVVVVHGEVFLSLLGGLLLNRLRACWGGVRFIVFTFEFTLGHVHVLALAFIPVVVTIPVVITSTATSSATASSSRSRIGVVVFLLLLFLLLDQFGALTFLLLLLLPNKLFNLLLAFGFAVLLEPGELLFDHVLGLLEVFGADGRRNVEQAEFLDCCDVKLEKFGFPLVRVVLFLFLTFVLFSTTNLKHRSLLTLMFRLTDLDLTVIQFVVKLLLVLLLEQFLLQLTSHKF